MREARPAAAAAWARRAARLSTASDLLVEDGPNWRAAWWAMDSRLGNAVGVGDFPSRRLVTGRSVMPQGLMRWKSLRSVVTLKAKPWEVMPRAT